MLLLGEGDYHFLSCKSLQLHSNLVIKGAGVNITNIYSSYCNISSGWLHFSDASLSNFSLTDLSFRAANVDAGFYGDAIRGSNIRTNIFVTRVFWELKTSSRLPLGGTNFLIQDFVAVAQSLPTNGYGSIYPFDCTKYGIWRNVWLYFENGWMTTPFCKYCVFENLHIIRDSSKQFIPEGPIQSRMWSCNFCENIVVDKSQFETLNFNFSKDNNDGETILTEGGGAKRGEFDIGQVSSATSTTLTSLTANWTLQTIDTLTITISDGPGFGQTRRLVSATSDTITVDEPWTVVPTAESKYSLVRPSFMNWLIKGSLLKGNPRGILIYAAAGFNVTISGNTIINGCGIEYKAFQRAYPSTAIDRCNGLSQLQIPFYQRQLTQVYRSRVLNNIVYADDPHAVAQIRVAGQQLSQQDTVTHGVLVFGVEVRGNNVTRVGEQVSTQGSYMVAMCFEQQVGLPNATLTSVIGTILQNNHVQGAPKAHAFGSNIGSSVLACQSVKITEGQVSVMNDTFSFDSNNCRFYASQTQDVHVLSDQCRSVNYFPPSHPDSATPSAPGNQPHPSPSVSRASSVTVGVVSYVLICLLAI